MTEEHGGVDPAPEQRGVTPPPQPDDSNVMDDAADAVSKAFSSGEGMVSLGGAVILVGWFLFAVIIADYFPSWIIVLFAALAVILPRMGRDLAERFAPLPTVMKTLGYLIGIVAAISLIDDVRFAGGQLDELVEILGALALYGGSGIALMGARSID